MSYGKRKKQIESPGQILPNKVVFEEVQTSRAPQFAMKTEKEIEIVPYIELGEIVYNPMVPSPWILPPPPMEYGSEMDLWRDIYGFVYDHLDIMDEDLYHIYVGWVIHTWITERFDSVPYLHFFGQRNTGKTRALDLLNLLCYRPMLSPSVSGAAVYYAMDYYQPTLLLDEFEMYEKQMERKAEVIGVLNAGYRRGQGVFRVGSVSEGNPTLRRFSVFGPKALSSIEDLPPALDSRCITFTMARAYKKVRRLIDKDRAQEIRGKLLQYRFNHLFDEVPKDINPIDLPDGRLIELYYPIDDVAPADDIKKTILQCAQNQYDGTIRKMRQEKPAILYNMLIDMIEVRIAEGKPFDKIFQKEIRDEYNKDLPAQSYERISKQKLPGILSQIHLEVRQDSKTRLMYVVINPRSLERHKTYYVLSTELGRVERIIDMVRGNMGPVVATLDTLDTLGVQGVTRETVNGGQQEDGSLHKQRNNKILSVSSISSVSNEVNEPNVEKRSVFPPQSIRKCSNCGIPLNTEVGEFMDKQTNRLYCRSCFTTMREQGLIG